MSTFGQAAVLGHRVCGLRLQCGEHADLIAAHLIDVTGESFGTDADAWQKCGKCWISRAANQP